MNLATITIYPVKSCAGIDSPSVVMDRFGPSGDRRWMVVNERGNFLTQRENPKMSQIGTVLGRPGMELGLECDGTQIDISIPDADALEGRVSIWGDTVIAQDAGNAAAVWLSKQLAEECRLVYMPEQTIRRVDGAYAVNGETVGFADGFPLLLISQASLDDLNERLPLPVPMNRFRPNLVVAGSAPFAEDKWRRIQIGAMEFDVAKACSRCAIPAIIQESGLRDPNINRTLASYRRKNGQIYFGQNLLYQQAGRLCVGDPVVVLE